VRNVNRTRSQAVGIGIVLLVAIVLGTEGAVGGHSHSTTGFVLGGVIFLLVAIPGARGALAVLIVTDQGVTVRNPFRTVSIAWDEVEAFELGRYKVLGCVCVVRRVDRTVVPAFAIQGITGQPRRRTSVLAKQTVDELNEQLTGLSGNGVPCPETKAS
jgi:PH (Pleckstrin Homology) domain-containing protein